MDGSADDPAHLHPNAPLATSSTLPPYPELIIAAIDTLNDPNGSNKTTISRHIEAMYPNLPSSHTTLLSHHLNRMKQNGDLVLVKNNYMKPDPNAPPKRGRGRPCKNAEPVPRGQASPPPTSAAKPRGRPPKSANSNSPLKLKPSVSGRKRGRPPKNNKAAPVASTNTVLEQTEVVGGVVKRGRGRPPKAKPAVVPVGA
ncbi:hypothetical protein MLD38_011358 [Melastoma candidum]|uniref:Uncharacterized protein n=1 Tax=Melastoma candidum TaxID=119954 RepID=A0ACB9R3C2_9MYRT|nr:hypothetical protein MLD38_011358 [Melastoma candidum]